MKDLVSIIMPNYNCAGYVGETIQSVLSQTYKNWELLIVDDCSKDNSVEIIKKYAEMDSRIKLFINPENHGAAYSRNVALREAEGEWIAFLDSDDLWTSQKLEKQLAFMQKNNYKFSYTSYVHIDENSQALNIRVTGPKKLTKRKMYHCCYPGCLTVMYNANAVGVLQIPEGIANGENDYALWLKAVKSATCYYLPEDLALYRVRGNSLSHGSNKKKLIKNHYVMYRLNEGRSKVGAAYHTLKNIFYTVLKKTYRVRKVKNG